MTKSQNPEGGQGSDSQMLNNQHQSQTFTGKKEEEKKNGGERKIEKKQEEKSPNPIVPTFIAHFQNIFLQHLEDLSTWVPI